MWHANPSRLGVAALLIAALTQAACDLGPDYRRPDLELPAAFRASPATQAAAWPPAEWWHAFNAPELDRLMVAAQAQNFDIAAAIGRIRQADAQVSIAGAPLLPQVTATGNASWQKSSTQGRGTFGASDQSRSYALTPVNISYELDFWGRNRALADAARALAVYSRFDQASVALTAASSVANTYFAALAFQDRLGIAQQNLRESTDLLTVIQARLAVGTATALDVAQQETLVAGQRAAIPSLRSQLEQEVIGLGILVGRPPEHLTIEPGTLDTLTVPAPAPGLPSSLIARRPDVAAAEAQLASQNADIRAARAAFFPAVSLSAAGGWQSLAIASLFGPGATAASLAGSVTQTIFDNGNLTGQLAQARGRYDELLADYRKSVVQAFTDVENAMTALRYTTEQETLERAAVASARRALDIARAQVAAGTVDITTALTAEQTLYGDEDTLVQVRLARFQAAVSLFQALGGGWIVPGLQNAAAPAAVAG